MTINYSINTPIKEVGYRNKTLYLMLRFHCQMVDLFQLAKHFILILINEKNSIQFMHLDGARQK